MELNSIYRSRSPEELGASMLAFMGELFPLCRSISGEGLRETLRRIGKFVPLEMTEVPSGTDVFDWMVPLEWNIRDAAVIDEDGSRVVDFRKSNLHVVNYSAPVAQTMSLDELRPYLHSTPDHPGWIPYRTSYYHENWGFCLTDEVLQSLRPGQYEVLIDSTLEPGNLTYGECVLPGSSRDEIFISSHVCHPSLANDNLSGVAVATLLAELLAETKHRYTYRFLFAPGTIGAISWLAQHETEVDRIRGGLVLACVGDGGPLTYKRSRRGNTEIDRAAEHVLRTRAAPCLVTDFSPYGNDERQFCSPGFNLPIGGLTRSGRERSDRDHTSADDLASISPRSLTDTLEACLAIVAVLEDNTTVTSLHPKCEPQLGRYGLYRSFGGRADQEREMAFLWVMSLADGEHSTLDVALRSGLPFDAIHDAVLALERAGLVTIAPADMEGDR